MRILIAVGLVLVVFRLEAQEPTARVGTVHATPTDRDHRAALPNILGRYEGTFQNKDSRKRPIGMALIVREQQPTGQFSGAVAMNDGGCAGQHLPMTGMLYTIGVARIKTGGACPLQLLVKMTGSTIQGEMQGGSDPYEVNLRKYRN